MDVKEDQIVAVRPDAEDPLSRGYICIKGRAIPSIEADPERLRQPLIREGDQLRPATWDEAYKCIGDRLAAVVQGHGRDAVAFYLGNATSHNFELYNYIPNLHRAARTPNVYTAQSQDNASRLAASTLMYGEPASVPVPDLHRAQLLWIIGANPAQSNGSMATATGWVKHMEQLKERGGRIVTIDPRRTETARLSQEHIAIRPGSDAAFLAGVAHVLLRHVQADSTHALRHASGFDRLREAIAPFAPERVAPWCDVAAVDIERLALELKDTRAAAVYGRIGSNTQRFGTLTAWMIDIVNILSGHLDEPGGSMFPTPLAAQSNTLGLPGQGHSVHFGRWRSRVRGMPEFYNELPTSCLAEEIMTPGRGQVKALITLAGNPGSSVIDHQSMQAALRSVDLLICVDNYVNETSMHADVLLPSPPRVARCNYDMYHYQWATRLYGRFTAPLRPLKSTERSDREHVLRIAMVLAGLPIEGDIDAFEQAALMAQLRAEIRRPGSTVGERTPEELFEQLAPLRWEERALDLLLRLGPFGDHFGARSGINLQTLRDTPHGLDLGPLVPRLPEVLRTPSGRIELICDQLSDELTRLLDWGAAPRPQFVLTGRRQIHSSNSWLNHVPKLRAKSNRCTLTMNPKDAADLMVTHGDLVIVARGAAQVTVQASLSDDIRLGVVSLPHGWGHHITTAAGRSALEYPGVNVNILTTGQDSDPISGCAELNGFAVDIVKAP